jgi:hypothetical protein
VRRRERLLLDLAGTLQVEGPKARRVGLGDVENPPVGRQADAVRGEERERDLPDVAAIRLRVIDSAAVLLARAPCRDR